MGQKTTKFRRYSTGYFSLARQYPIGYYCLRPCAPRELRTYQTAQGRKPFEEWLFSLKDKAVIARIVARLNRVAHGNLGDVKCLGDGLSELRLMFRSGYRVYFGQEGRVLILLLCGGDKATQRQDIEKAKAFLADYRRRKDE